MTSARRITLLRHAKSGWSRPGEPDVERTLTRRGVADARAVAGRFAAQQLSVSLVLCSPATRTRNTWELVRDGLDGRPRVEFPHEIYQAGSVTLLALLRGLPEEVEHVLLIGHNPAISDLAFELAGDGAPDALNALADRFSPATYATLRTRCRWGQLRSGCAVLESFVRPGDVAR